MAAGYNKTFSLAQFPKDFGLWYLAPLSTIFQLYHGGHVWRIFSLVGIFLIWHSKMFMFLAHLPKGQVSFCHHLASVVHRKLFQKSSPVKVLDQWKPSLVWIINRMSSFKMVSGDAVHQPTWLLLLKIEHTVKLQVFG